MFTINKRRKLFYNPILGNQFFIKKTTTDDRQRTTVTVDSCLLSSFLSSLNSHLSTTSVAEQREARNLVTAAVIRQPYSRFGGCRAVTLWQPFVGISHKMPLGIIYR